MPRRRKWPTRTVEVIPPPRLIRYIVVPKATRFRDTFERFHEVTLEENQYDCGCPLCHPELWCRLCLAESSGPVERAQGKKCERHPDLCHIHAPAESVESSRSVLQRICQQQGLNFSNSLLFEPIKQEVKAAPEWSSASEVIAGKGYRAKVRSNPAKPGKRGANHAL